MSFLTRSLALVGVALFASAPFLSAQSGVPVIQQIPDQEMSYGPAGNIGYPQSIPVYVSNNPTSLTATGLPPYVTFYASNNPVSGSGPAFVWQDGPSWGSSSGGYIPGGNFTVTVNASNAAGASAPMSFHWLIHPGIVGYITPDKPLYVVGETIHFLVQYSLPVVVTGTPYLPLWNGQRANYVSGSGTDKLQFDHTIIAADGLIRDFYVYHIVLGDGTIATADGISATLSDHENIASGPRKLSIIPPDPQIQEQRYSATVGLPTSIHVAARNVEEYKVIAGSLPPGLTLGAANGWITGTPTEAGTWTPTIQVTAGQTASAVVTLNVSPAAPPGAPVFASVSPRDDFYGEFGNIGFYSSDHIQVSNSPTSVTATGVPPGIMFSGDSTSAGFLWSMDRLSGGEYQVTLTATNSAGTGTTSFYWTIHPGLRGYITPDRKSYTVGDTITLSAQFSAPVVVAGTPTIALWGTKHADYASGSGTNTLTFRYTVAADDVPQSGAAAKVITLGNSYITTPGGTPAAKLTVTETMGTAYPTFDIVAAPPTTPPPTTTPPPSTEPPSTPPPSTTPPPTQQSQTITFTSPAGAVMIGQPITLGATSSAGLPITYSVVSGNATLSGNTLTPLSTATLVVRAASAGDATYAAASTDVNFGNPQKAAQTINAGTTTQAVKPESTVTLAATTTSGLPVTYSVTSGSAFVSGNTLTILGSSGTVTVQASQAGNDTYAAAPNVTLRFDIVPLPLSRLVNISSRLRVSANDSNGASIAGFVIVGTASKTVLIRGVGPTLVNYGVGSPLTNPQLKLYNNDGVVLATNAGWNDKPDIAAAATAVGAFPYPAGSKDAALYWTLSPGAYTVQIESGGSGTALIEVYDVPASNTTTRPLINISTRGTVGTGDDVLIGGFVIRGDVPKRVLIRGIGPKLADFGVPNVLGDPMLTVYDSKQVVTAKNDNWGTPQPLTSGQSVGTATEIAAAATATGAFPLTSGSTDAVLLLTLDPGAYSAIVSGANNSRGAAMIEIYEVPQ